MAPLPVQSVIPGGSVAPMVGAGPAAGPAAVEVLVGQAGVLDTMLAGAGAQGLLECFAAIDDPRDRRGIRHSLASILGLCTAAVTSGQLLLDDITAWVSAADPQVLAAFGCRRDAEGRFTPPHPDTVERVFALLQAQQVADGVGTWLAARAGVGPVAAPTGGPGWLPAIAVDGKAVRGAIGEDGQVPYLLAAATHEESVVLAERLIGAKTNEVPEFAPLLRGLAESGRRGRRVRVHHGRRAHRPRPRPTDHLRTARALRDDRQAEHEARSTTRSTPWTGRTPRSPTKPSTSGTAGETSAPSGSATPRPISGSPVRRRCSWSSGTPPAPSANAPRAPAATRRCRSAVRWPCSA